MGVGSVGAPRGVVQQQVRGGGASGAPDPGQLGPKAKDSDAAAGAANIGCMCCGGGAGAGSGAEAGPSGAKGAKGAPDAAPPKDEPKEKPKDAKPKDEKPEQSSGGGGAGASEYASPKTASASPKQLAGETSQKGLQPKALQVLSAAHDAGLKLMSGLRPGDPGGHGNGSAVDVSNMPGGSSQGSPELERFAEAMRAAGKAGDPTVGYVIYNQRIASARDNWAWRPMEDRGSNTQNHKDHVHVSTDPNR